MKNKRMQFIKGLMAVFLVMCLLVPVGIAFAEDYGRTSVVVLDAGEVIGDTYQRHTFIAEGLHWVFYANDSQILYTSSADATTWETPTKFDDYTCNVSPIEGCCNGSSFALWYDLAVNYVDVAWMNRTGLGESIYYIRGTPATNGTILWGTAYEAVAANTSLTTSHPSICDNTLDYPFISYMVYDHEALLYSGSISTSATNASDWTAATNSTISSSVSLNISLNVLYPSVVPVSDGNISVMVAFNNGVDWILGQNYLDYDVATDTWAYPATAQFPLPATSYLDADDIMYHSEVAWSGNLTTPDDVFVVATANDSLLGKYYFFDRYGDPASPFADDTALGMGYYVGSIGIRNALGDMVATAVEQTQKTQLYSADYDITANTWVGLTAIEGIDATSAIQTESDYDNAGTDYLGTVYYDHDVAFIPDLEYGCYGCPAVPDTIIDTFGNLAGVVASLVISFLIIAFLLGIAVKESMTNGNTEAIKVSIFGIIGIIIIETIVIAFF
jgi:hypothetical protein